MPPVPSDDRGPVFREPWEAQAFAMVVALHAADRFTWPEWVQAVSAEIGRAQRAGDPDLGGTNYRHWLAALETITVAKSLATDTELRLRRMECAANAAAHIHVAKRDPVRVV